MAERKDGIKSFFMKQSPKKAAGAGDKPPPKPISKAELMGKEAGGGDVKKEEKDVKEEEKPAVNKEEEPDIKEEDKPDIEAAKADVKGAEGEVKPDDKKLGQRGKAKPEPEVIDVDEEPSSQSQPSSSQGKRKREDTRGGRQTKVVRQTPKEQPKEEGQKPITSFFKSPKK